MKGEVKEEASKGAQKKVKTEIKRESSKDIKVEVREETTRKADGILCASPSLVRQRASGLKGVPFFERCCCQTTMLVFHFTIPLTNC